MLEAREVELRSIRVFLALESRGLNWQAGHFLGDRSRGRASVERDKEIVTGREEDTGRGESQAHRPVFSTSVSWDKSHHTGLSGPLLVSGKKPFDSFLRFLFVSIQTKKNNVG